MANPIQLTPEEVAEYEKAAAPAAINPLRDFSSDELFDLATKDKENFDLVSEFRRNKDLWKDPNTVQKVAEVHSRIKDRGFELSDIPGPGKIAHTVFDIAKGFGKQAWNYANALVGVPIAGAIGEITGDANQPGFSKELAQEGQRRVMENLAGTEAAAFGVARMGEKLVGKVRRLADQTPEQKLSDLWADVGSGDVDEDILKGKGALLGATGGAVRQELEAAGKPIRVEETSALAAGDPLSFYTFGKIFQGAGKLVPKTVAASVDKAATVAGNAAEVAGGRAVQAAGVLTDLGGRAVKIAAPAVGMVKGAIEAGPLGALAGLKGGEIASKIGSKISKGGKALAEAGKEIAGAAPVAGGVTQLAKDVIGGVPVAATEIGKGLAFDIGTAALTSEGPRDTESVGIGAFFGGLGAAQRVGRRVISGQLVGPRAWGSDQVTPSSRRFSNLDSMHADAVKDATPAVRTRLNAIRQFLKGSHADTDVFLAKDAQAVESAMLQSGASPEQAKQFSQTEGFFVASLPDASGNPRRVIVARNVDAAPHESFHAIQDVLGESANQAIDQIVREEYGPQWEQEGNKYAARIGEGEWREVVLDSTGTGLNYAKEKIAMDVANEYRAATGAEPPSGFVQDRVKAILGQVMDSAVQANPDVSPNDIAGRVWRDILSPQEATAVADSYLARELAAENFDMVFKQGGDLQNVSGLTGRLARIVAQLVSTLGGEPLSPERPSQIGEIAPRFRVTEAVRNAPELVQPREAGAPASRPTVTTTPNEPLPNTPSSESEAQKIAAEAPENPITAGAASPREILGNVAEAIAQQAGLKVNYLSAPGEPAGAITSNRDARRAVIEWARTASPEVRAMWEKNFFPDRVIKLKGDKYQILGWAPEVFAANAHKLAAKLQELGVAESSPYPVKDGTFTPEGWQELFKDTQAFVQNQMGGRTGAGESLVVPRNVAERGFYAPPIRGQAEALPQLKADFINMLFGFKIPDTARVQKGKLPLNLAGQAVSEATQPGRTEIPVIPRGRFEGAEAERQGIAGQDIKEVNPLRQQIEAAAQAKGVAMPEFIEAQQRLNLENIKDVQVAPEQPQFRGNTLTLSAGFQPNANPRAVRSPVVRDEKGKTWEGMFHGTAERAARDAGREGPFEDGFITNSGEFLNRQEAFERAQEFKQIAPPNRRISIDEAYGLESSQVTGSEAANFLASRMQPQTAKGKEVSDAGFDFESYGFRGTRGVRILKDGVRVGDISSAMLDPKQPNTADVSMVYVDEGFRRKGLGEALYRELATELQKDGVTELLGDAVSEEPVRLRDKVFGPTETLPQEHFDSRTDKVKSRIEPSAKFQPKAQDIAVMDANEFRKWTESLGPGKGFTPVAIEMGKKADNPDTLKVTYDALLDQAREVQKQAIASKDIPKMEEASALISKAQFFREAWESATGVGSASQKNLDAAAVQMQPKKELKLKPAGRDGVSKVWVLPDGKVVNIGGQWHHEYLNDNPALRKQYKLSDDTSQDNRLGALQKGFARLNWSYGNGHLTIEARTKDWPKQREAIRSFVEANADKIDRMQVVLMSDNLKKVDDAHEVSVFTMEDNEKAAALPFNDLGDKRATGEASDRLFEKAASKAQLQPTAVKDVAEDYAKKAGIEYRPSTERSNVPLDTAQKVADFFEAAKHSPSDAKVKASYDALAKETLAQYETMREAGYTIEPFTGKGEPYKSSADMVKDVNENKHLYFLPTDGNFKGGEGNPMLETSGVGDLLVNDVFRAVHDFFGHAKEGLQFGPKGEFNAWKVHSEMYSPEAQGALAAETLAQNFWVNYGKHLRRKDGSVPAKGDEDFVALPDRPFAEQKNIVIPDELLSEVRAQFQPGKGIKIKHEADERVGGLTVLTVQAFKDGKQVGAASFNVRSWQKDLFPAGVMVEEKFQRQGIATALYNYARNLYPDYKLGKPSQAMARTPEGSAFRKAYDSSAQFQPKGDKEKVTSAAIRYGKKVYEGATHPEAYDAALADGKTEDATFESGFVTSTERFISADEAWVLGKGTKPPTGGAHSEDLDIQFQPSGEKNLFGAEEAKRSLSSSEVANMSLKALREYYPEATVPSKDELIPSEILKSPLYKEAGGEAEAVQAFADRLGEFYESVKIDPVVKAGVEWYDKFTPMLKKEFGDDAQIFAELLAATSPQTSIDTNFKYSVDALEGLKSGRFKKVISKFEQGLEMIAKDTWKAWYNKELKNIPKPPVKPTAATFLEHWIDKHDLKPKQSNGKLYGIHSLPVLRVFARQWLVKTTGPKTQNFVENLIGKSDEATIDLWADRTMRRIGYEGVERWRILPKNAAPVVDKEFYFAQKSFRRAAEKLGLRPSALQGALWFAEKQLWAKNGWSRLDLGDFRDQMENLPAIRQSIKKDLTSTQPSRKVKELDLELVQPRKKNERY